MALNTAVSLTGLGGALIAQAYGRVRLVSLAILVFLVVTVIALLGYVAPAAA